MSEPVAPVHRGMSVDPTKPPDAQRAAREKQEREAREYPPPSPTQRRVHDPFRR